MKVKSLRYQCIEYIFKDNYSYVSDLFDQIPEKLKNENESIQMLYIMHCVKLRCIKQSIEFIENAIEKTIFVRIYDSKDKNQTIKKMEFEDYLQFIVKDHSSLKKKAMRYEDVIIEYIQFMIGERYFREVISEDCVEVIKYTRHNIDLNYIVEYLKDRDYKLMNDITLFKNESKTQWLLKEFTFGLLLLYFKIPYLTETLAALSRSNVKCLLYLVRHCYYILPRIDIIVYKDKIFNETQNKPENLCAIESHLKFYKIGKDIHTLSLDILPDICEEIEKKLIKTYTFNKKNSLLEHLRRAHLMQFKGITLSLKSPNGKAIHKYFKRYMGSFEFIYEKYHDIQSYNHLSSMTFENCQFLYLKSVKLPENFLNEDKFPVLVTLILDGCIFTNNENIFISKSKISNENNSDDSSEHSADSEFVLFSSENVKKRRALYSGTKDINTAKKSRITPFFPRSVRNMHLMNMMCKPDFSQFDFRQFEVLEFKNVDFETKVKLDKQHDFSNLLSLSIDESFFLYYIKECRNLRNLHVSFINHNLMEFVQKLTTPTPQFQPIYKTATRQENLNHAISSTSEKHHFTSTIVSQIDIEKDVAIETFTYNPLANNLNYFTFNNDQDIVHGVNILKQICELMPIDSHIHIEKIRVTSSEYMELFELTRKFKCESCCDYNLKNNFIAPTSYVQFSQKRKLYNKWKNEIKNSIKK